MYLHRMLLHTLHFTKRSGFALLYTKLKCLTWYVLLLIANDLWYVRFDILNFYNNTILQVLDNIANA